MTDPKLSPALAEGVREQLQALIATWRKEAVRRIEGCYTVSRQCRWCGMSITKPLDNQAFAGVPDMVHAKDCPITQLDSALAEAAVPPRGWQPIESAPKDTRILAFETVPDHLTSYPPSGFNLPHVFIAYWWGGDSLNSARWRGGVTINPSHWMPLPDPPLPSSGSPEGGDTK